MKRIAAILAAVLAIGMCAYAQEAGELAKYGIMQGDPDGNMRLEDGVTRAEMAKIIVTALDYGACANTDTSFSDVASSHWASGYINEAYKAGIIAGRGDGTFAPEDGVTNEEAVKMIVCALGYDVLADMYGGYPFGYMQTAERQGVLANLNLNGKAKATRGDVAALMCNALDIPFLRGQKSEDGSGMEYVIMDGKKAEKLTMRTQLEQ